METNTMKKEIKKMKEFLVNNKLHSEFSKYLVQKGIYKSSRGLSDYTYKFNKSVSPSKERFNLITKEYKGFLKANGFEDFSNLKPKELTEKYNAMKNTLNSNRSLRKFQRDIGNTSYHIPIDTNNQTKSMYLKEYYKFQERYGIDTKTKKALVSIKEELTSKSLLHKFEATFDNGYWIRGFIDSLDVKGFSLDKAKLIIDKFKEFKKTTTYKQNNLVPKDTNVSDKEIKDRLENMNDILNYTSSKYLFSEYLNKYGIYKTKHNASYINLYDRFSIKESYKERERIRVLRVLEVFEVFKKENQNVIDDYKSILEYKESDFYIKNKDKSNLELKNELVEMRRTLKLGYNTEHFYNDIKYIYSGGLSKNINSLCKKGFKLESTKIKVIMILEAYSKYKQKHQLRKCDIDDINKLYKDCKEKNRMTELKKVSLKVVGDTYINQINKGTRPFDRERVQNILEVMKNKFND